MKVRIALLTGVLVGLTSLTTAVQAGPYGERYQQSQQKSQQNRQHKQARVVKKKVVKRHGQRKVIKQVRHIKKARPYSKNKRHFTQKRHVAKYYPRWKPAKKRWSNKFKHRKFYRVKRGDSIGKIARKTGVSVRKLVRLNRHKVSARHGYRIYIGQRLRLRR